MGDGVDPPEQQGAVGDAVGDAVGVCPDPAVGVLPDGTVAGTDGEVGVGLWPPRGPTVTCPGCAVL